MSIKKIEKSINEEVKEKTPEVKEVEVKEETIPENQDSMLSELVRELISDKFSEITNLNALIRDSDIFNGRDDVKEIFNSIVDDYNIHVGLLQSILEGSDSNAIKKNEEGKAKAEEIVNSLEETPKEEVSIKDKKEIKIPKHFKEIEEIETSDDNDADDDELDLIDSFAE